MLCKIFFFLNNSLLVIGLCRVISHVNSIASAKCLAWTLTTNQSPGFSAIHIADASQWYECHPPKNQTRYRHNRQLMKCILNRDV